MSHDHGGSVDSSTIDMDQFCNGDGTVMMSGFQAAEGAMQSCILFLFEGAVVDSEVKYAFALIGAFLMGFTNEMIRYGRDRMGKALGVGIVSDFAMTAAFAVQMFLAYMMMLLVMLYEYRILIMLILGLAAGHLATLRLSASRRRAALQSGSKTPPETRGNSSTPCCNNETLA